MKANEYRITHIKYKLSKSYSFTAIKLWKSVCDVCVHPVYLRIRLGFLLEYDKKSSSFAAFVSIPKTPSDGIHQETD